MDDQTNNLPEEALIEEEGQEESPIEGPITIDLNQGTKKETTAQASVDPIKVEEPQKEEAEVVPVTPAPVKGGKWYVVHIKTGYEGRVKKALEQRIKSLGVGDRIFEIVIPMREIVIVKKGKKSKVNEKVFPGYLLVRMDLDDDSWLAVRTTEGVTGFVGAGLKPTPISDREVEAIMKFLKQEQPKFKTKFSAGEAVKITDGPFADFLGTIEAIDEARGKVKVLVSIFDRETPVELDFLQVTKL